MKSPLAIAQAVHTLGGQTMGTSWCVRLAGARHTDLDALHATITARLARVVRQMSTWEPDSDICRYNRAEPGQWVAIPAEFEHVLACALAIASASEGAFDPAVGALVDLWGFGPAARQTDATPEPATLAAARAGSGWREVVLDRAAGRVLQPGGVQLDLSAIAKGFAADDVATCLRESGVGAALVDIGGELVGYGRKPDGTPWRVLVEAGPEEEEEEEEDRLDARVLQLDELAVATSGDRWHHYTRAGRRYTHTIDPRSGEPVAHAPAAVSVIAADAMHADAWATALSVLGVEAGQALAVQHGLAVRFLWRDGEHLQECMTDGFRRHMAA